MKQLLWLTIVVPLCAACARAPAATAPAALPTARVAIAPTQPQPPTPALPTLTRIPATAAPTAPPATTAPTAPPATAAPSPTTALQAEPSAMPAPDESAALEQRLIDAINQTRAANGLPAYQASPELSAAARAHSCDLAQHQLISHVSTDGRTLADRLAGATPPWQWPSENIAAGLADPDAVVALWMDEPPEGWHRRNILDPEQQAVGAGYCQQLNDPSGNQHYWTADFARH